MKHFYSSPSHNAELDIIPQKIFSLLKSISKNSKMVRLRLKGNSMLPFLKDGDMVTISSKCQIEAGDIALLFDENQNKIQAHRVISREKNYYHLKGDNLNVSDGFKLGSFLLGRIIKIERKGKKINFGLGPEKIIIAFLSRLNLLPKITRALRLFKIF